MAACATGGATAVGTAAAFFAPAPTAGAAGALPFGRTASVNTGATLAARFAVPFAAVLTGTTTSVSNGASAMASGAATVAAVLGAAVTASVRTGAAGARRF